jgi:hypothetical protein
MFLVLCKINGVEKNLYGPRFRNRSDSFLPYQGALSLVTALDIAEGIFAVIYVHQEEPPGLRTASHHGRGTIQNY